MSSPCRKDPAANDDGTVPQDNPFVCSRALARDLAYGVRIAGSRLAAGNEPALETEHGPSVLKERAAVPTRPTLSNAVRTTLARHMGQPNAGRYGTAAA